MNAERQWKSSNGAAFNALVVVTIILGLNVGALVGTIPAALHLPHPRMHSDKNLAMLLFVAMASLSWLAFVRNGKGLILAEELKRKGKDSILRCQIVTFGALFASAAVFFGPIFIVICLHRPTPANVQSSDNQTLSSQAPAR